MNPKYNSSYGDFWKKLELFLTITLVILKMIEIFLMFFL